MVFRTGITLLSGLSFYSLSGHRKGDEHPSMLFLGYDIFTLFLSTNYKVGHVRLDPFTIQYNTIFV